MLVQRLRIFAVADIHSPDNFVMPRLTPDQYDLLVTLGDIDIDTLDYIWHMASGVPWVGVLGNHDQEASNVCFLPSVHGCTMNFHGVCVGGCGGGPRYKKAPNHYTEREVRKVLRRVPGADLFLSHAPPPVAVERAQVAAGRGRIHRGFDEFDRYLTATQPQFWLHGHLSARYSCTVGKTTVIGVAGAQSLVLDFLQRPAVPQTHWPLKLLHHLPEILTGSLRPESINSPKQKTWWFQRTPRKLGVPPEI
jgi:Icc-related predicted phosphoesterase